MNTLRESQETKMKYEALQQLKLQLAEKKKEVLLSKAVDRKINGLINKIRSAYEALQELLTQYPDRHTFVQDQLQLSHSNPTTEVALISVPLQSEKKEVELDVSTDETPKLDNNSTSLEKLQARCTPEKVIELLACKNRNEIELFKEKNSSYVFGVTLDKILKSSDRDNYIEASKILLPGTPLRHGTGMRKEIVFFAKSLSENEYLVFPTKGKPRQIKELGGGTTEWDYSNTKCPTEIKKLIDICIGNSEEDW